MPAARRVVPLLCCLAAASSAAMPGDAWQRLQSPDFAEREKATQDLWRQGEAARERLRDQAEHGTPDAQERCRRVLWLLDLGLPAEAPPAAVDAVVGYDVTAALPDKRRRLMNAGQALRKYPAVLLKLGLDEPELSARRIIYGLAGPAALADAARRLIDGGDDAALRRFAAAYDGVDAVDGGTTTLALVLAGQAGTLEADAAELAARPRRSGSDNAKLARAYAALGRPDAAIAVADTPANTGGRPFNLAMKLRVSNADWPGLLQTAEVARLPGVRAAALQLTGDAVAAQAAVADRMQARGNAVTDPAARRQIAQLCLLNDMTATGVWLMGELGEVAVLRAQGRWDEALKLAKPDNLNDPDGLIAVRLAGDRDALRREAGLLPTLATPQARDTAADPLPFALKAAAAAYARGDFVAAVVALDAVPKASADAPPFAAVAAETAADRLRGLCLDRLKRPDAARVARQRAERLCATGDRVWVAAIGLLDDAGLTDVADAEADRLARFRPESDWAGATLAERTARRATAARDYAAAATARDRLLAWHALGQVTYTDAAGYLRGPALRHAAHARLALSKQDAADAIEHLRLAAACLPINGQLAIEFVPKLRAAGQDKAADELFEGQYRRQADLAAAYPKSAAVRNGAAWTALRCDRHLDAALKLSEEAVALRPGEPAYLDTYAEALFKNGRRADAVAAMKKAAALMPDEKMIRDRLAAFQAGNVFVPEEPE